MTPLAELGIRMRQLEARRAAALRRARWRPDGKLGPRPSDNREIARMALVREPIPGGDGAEFWMTYTPGREEFLRLRDAGALAGFASALLPNITSLLDPDALNGYVAFPKRRAPRLPRDMGNLVQFIPVHGGVSWVCKDSYMAVWGFDTLHAHSEHQPRTDRDWIRAHCWVLYRGLLLAEKLWPRFRCGGHAERVEIVQQLLALVEEESLPDKLGFTAMISMLLGRIGTNG